MDRSAAAQAWLQCTVMPGLFPDEFEVSFTEALHHAVLSILVDRTLVQTASPVSKGAAPVQGKVRVYLSGGQGTRAHVMLPVQTAEYGSVVAVNRAQLEETEIRA
jgi:hypothetical protein